MPYPTTRTTLLNRLNGDEAAWREFFDRYRGVIASIGLSKGFSPDECDDLIQNVMIRFHKKIQAGFAYDPVLAKFRTFFIRLIEGCICDMLRKRDKCCFTVDELPETGEGERPDELLDMVLLEKWRTILREEAMLELAGRVDERTFQAFELYALKGRSAKETAELLSISTVSVYVAKNRCTKILRKIIARLNTEDPELHLE